MCKDGQQELFYSRAISTYFDAQIGARYDLDSLARRGWIALGVEGLAPGSFQVAATGYVGGNGRLAAKLEGSVDLLITQRLILQPQVEMNIYSQDDLERGSAPASRTSMPDFGCATRSRASSRPMSVSHTTANSAAPLISPAPPAPL